ncbi:MAG: Arc family DNA-binding protein [Cytophagales bacterium]|nr:MAG: Arc family DNA-binding protein [Cytophagales bacterium]
MSKKKPFALRLDAELLEALEKWAADEFRSTNGQIEWILHQALQKAGRLPQKKKENEQNNDELANEES